MYSNVMRMTGLFSGMDTEAMVKQLMNAETMKYTRLKQQRQKVEWKQQAYRSVAKSLSDFRSANLTIKDGTISAYSTFNTLTSSVKDSAGNNSSAIKVNTSSNATPIGDLKIEVHSVAQKDAYMGGNVAQRFNASGDISAEDLTNGSAITFNVSMDGGASTRISVGAQDLTAYANANNLDIDADFNEVLAGAVNQKLDAQFGKGYESVNGRPVFDGTTGQFKTTDELKVSLNYDAANDSFYFESAAGHIAQIEETPGLTNNSLAAMGFESSGSTAFDINTKLGITSSDFLNINNKSIVVTADDTYATLMEKINSSDAGVTMTFNKTQSAFLLESNKTGESAKIKGMSASDGLMEKFGFRGYH